MIKIRLYDDNAKVKKNKLNHLIITNKCVLSILKFNI